MKITKTVITIVAIAVVAILGENAYLIYHSEGISKKVKEYRTAYSNAKRSKWMHEQTCDVSSLPALKDDTAAWYSKYRLIAHGGGAVDGCNYTNSLEAWNNSYERGIRVFDADLRFTTDGVLVLRHSWKDNLEQDPKVPLQASNSFVDENGHTQYTYENKAQNLRKFKSLKIYRRFTPMTYEDMVRYMQEHKDLYVAADIKGGGNGHMGDSEATYRYMVKEAKRLKAEDILDRIIVSCYNYSDYEKIEKIYPFQNVTMRQHAISPNNYYELCKFCLDNNIHTVNVSKCFVDDEGVKLLASKGIKLYVAVVDYLSDAEWYQKKGIYGFVTNYLTENILTPQKK